MEIQLVLLAGFFATLGGLFALLAWGRSLPIDRPNARSLHTNPTPRIGGLAVMPSILLVEIVANQGPFSWVVGSAAAVLFLFSAVDDRGGLPVALRFAAHIGAALVVVLQFDLPWLAALPVVFAVTWMTNLYNFMDGANGIAGGMSVVGFGAYALAANDPGLVLWAACCAASALAFLYFNFDPAKVFMGDAGSIPLGFLAGSLGLWGIMTNNWPWWFPLLVFSPFIFDASMTLVKRILRYQPVWQAHREHYYQRLIQMGWSHRRLALVAYFVMLVMAGLALAALRSFGFVQQALLWAVPIIYLMLAGWVDWRWRARSAM